MILLLMPSPVDDSEFHFGPRFTGFFTYFKAAFDAAVMLSRISFSAGKSARLTALAFRLQFCLVEDAQCYKHFP